ncbi:unnamed protein product, partial [Didymodactylos carnosus]
MFVIILLFFVGLVQCDRSFVININQNGEIVHQNVTEKDDLLIIDVPGHTGVVHATYYLDYRSGYELVNFVNQGKCHLSTIDENIRHSKMVEPPQLSQVPGAKAAVYDASQFQRTNIIRLEQENPMGNTSFLRSELQSACRDRPIYYVKKMLEADLAKMKSDGRVTSTDDGYLIPTYLEGDKSMTCDIPDVAADNKPESLARFYIRKQDISSMIQVETAAVLFNIVYQ